MTDLKAALKNAHGPKAFERAMQKAREDLQWWHTIRVSKLDLSSFNFEQGDSLVWDKERLSALHDRQLDKMADVVYARAIAGHMSVLTFDDREDARRRWMSFNDEAAIVAKAFSVEGEDGTYLGVVVALPAAMVALAEERAKKKDAPRTPLEMLQRWARGSSRRRIEDLRRQAIRSYGRVLHTYANGLLGGT